MALLAELREQGVRLSADGETVTVRPRAALTDALRATIRMHKAAILRELAAEAVNRRKAIAAARDAAPLSEYRAALILGRLHLCANCAQFTFGSEPTRGQCRLFGVEAIAFVPFQCPDYQVSASPTVPLDAL
jgi:hypothetical protein